MGWYVLLLGIRLGLVVWVWGAFRFRQGWGVLGWSRLSCGGRIFVGSFGGFGAF